jgi:hypothetical protein
MRAVDGWGALVDAWDELERVYRVYEEELPKKEFPRLHALMRSLEASQRAR